MQPDDPLLPLLTVVRTEIDGSVEQFRGLKSSSQSQAQTDLGDERWIGGWGTPIREAQTGMVTQVFHSLDCAAAYCRLLVEPAAPYAASSYWVLARAALEGLARANYVVGDSPQDRVARAINDSISATRDPLITPSRTTAASHGGPSSSAARNSSRTWRLVLRHAVGYGEREPRSSGAS